MRSKKTILFKFIAYYLLLNVLITGIVPSVAVASAYQAESTSQSVSYDDGEAVDLTTGDFSYNVPLLTLPGFKGGYPVNLNYYSGIQAEQNASWVGLGWSLNAGAISRDVNVHPDDCDFSYLNVKNDWTGSLAVGYEVWNPGTDHQTQSTSSGLANKMGNGVLNFNDTTEGSDMDHYLLSDLSVVDSTYYTSSSGNPLWMVGGIVPGYDNYNVSGWGISGQIEPVLLENGTITGSSQIISFWGGSTDYLVYNVLKDYTRDKKQFRFKNEVSNRFLVTPSNMSISSTAPIGTIAYPTTDGTLSECPYTGPDEKGYNPSTMQLGGENQVNYYTNTEIVSTSAQKAGFINYAGAPARGYFNVPAAFGNAATNLDITTAVGGFSITRSDGTTYHYALPVYEYNKMSTAWSVSQVGGTNRHKEYYNTEAHAYQWLLTTITGNDFVDANGNGLADEADSGEWMNFNYGLWNNNYIDRTPYTGTIKGMDNSDYAEGIYKQIYYLDAIYTRSHTALFLKETRTDAYGSSTVFADYTTPLKTEGGYSSTTSVGTLKLQSVNLYRNEDLISMSAVSTNTFNKDIYSCIQEIKKLSTQKYSTSYSSFIDYYDIYTGGPNMATCFPVHNVLKRAGLNYDYSLATQSLNSTLSQGRLTLKNVYFYGRNETRDLPSMDFQYELPAPQSFTGQLTIVPADYGVTAVTRDGRIDFGNTPNPFQEGDIVEMNISGVNYYGTLVRGMVYAPYGTHVSLYDIHFLGTNIPTATQKGILVTAKQTKNPPYTVDHRDNWGYFKSDYLYQFYGAGHSTAEVSGIENYDRRTNRVSAQGVDVWCLRRIVNSAGATIDLTYESDSHSNITDNRCKSRRSPKGLLNVKEVGYTLNDGTTTFASPTIKFSVNSMNRAGTFQIRFKEEVNCGDEFYVNQVIRMATAATFIQNGGSYDGSFPRTYTGADLFKITAVSDNITGSNYIQGVFVQDLTSTTANPTNPLAGTQYVCAAFDLWLSLNGSYVMYEPLQKYGGGVRIKKYRITENNTGEYFETQYGYINNGSGYSSGTTASEPLNYGGVLPLDSVSSMDHDRNNFHKCRQKYQIKNLYTGFYNDLSQNYHQPGVIYEYVTKTQFNNGVQAPAYDFYKFKVFSDNLLAKTATYNQASGVTVVRTMTLTDSTSLVGHLLENRKYDLQNNMLSRTQNTYAATNQGLIEQVFHQYRTVMRNDGGPTDLGIIAKRSNYPCVLTSSTSNDYVKGTQNTMTVNTWDFYTGDPLQVQTQDGYGNKLLSIKQPAYHLNTSYPTSSGAEMGLKVNNPKNKHMLTPLAASYSCKMNTSGTLAFTVSSLASSTGASTTRYKAVLSGSQVLPYYFVSNMNQTVSLTIGGTSTPATVTISYIYPDRKSFEFYYTNASLGSAGSVTNVNTYAPLSASIQPWTNNSTYRNYNTTTAVFENQTVTESSPVNYFDYKKMWRQDAPYVWNSPFLATDGGYLASGTGAYQEFDWSLQLAGSAQSSSFWQKLSSATLQDKYSNAMEVKDVNGNYAATKMAYDQSYVLANTGAYTYTYPSAIYNNYVLSSGKNTNAASFGFSGFEELTKPTGATYNQYGGEVQVANSNSPQVSASGGINPHSGNYALKLGAGGYNTLFSTCYKSANTEGNIIRGKKYRASVWVHNSSNSDAGIAVSMTGSSGTFTSNALFTKASASVTIGNWTLLTLDVDVPAAYNSVASTDVIIAYLSAGTGGYSYFDDFAFRPIDADQTSYVYDPLTKQVLATIDKNNLYTRFEYDNTGRMTASYKETLNGEKKVSTQSYNFAKP
jgi:hypothetical protein